MNPDETPQNAVDPAEEPKVIERVAIIKVTNGYLVHELGCQEKEIAIATTLEAALDMARALLV